MSVHKNMSMAAVADPEGQSGKDLPSILAIVLALSNEELNL